MFDAIPPAALADWCRRMRHQLGAGVSLNKLLAHLSDAGPPSLRAMSARLRQGVQAGQPMARGLEHDAAHLPSLFVPLFRVGEETGRLPEILGELEDYLVEQDRLRRQFRQQTMLPKAQLVLAILVIAGLIWILGAIATSRGTPPISIFGLTGSTGALIFLTCTFGPLILLWLLFNNVIGSAGLRDRLQQAMLHVPAVGACVQAIVLNRLAVALQHTLNSSLSVAKALRLSFAATGNPAFEIWADPAIDVVKRGGTVVEALRTCPLLPQEFLDMALSGEEGGTLPEMMKHQARYYQELASDRLTMLTRLASGGIWLLVAIFIVFCIFRIAGVYLSALGA